MCKPKRNILCYSWYEFRKIMQHNNWVDSLSENYCAISICTSGEGECSEHWFKNDCHNSQNLSVFNLDVDDSGPFWFENHESRGYDESLDLYLSGKIKQANAYFTYPYVSGENREYFDILHVLDYEEAFDLVKWIDDKIKTTKTFLIHCAVGASRSQGVVRYILDTYNNEYNIFTNPDNPCLAPNQHITMMLKRAYRSLYNNDIDESYFELPEPDLSKLEHIKLNLL